jgi:arylsulfatase
MEPHTPYDVPGTTEKFNVVIGEALSGNVENPEQLREAYRKVTGQLSEDYRNLYENLAADFDYIITLSDHGEMLGEEGMWNHGYGLYPELTHIPLVIDGPGFEDISVKTPVNLIDLHETLAGLASARSYSKGRDLSEDSIPTKALVTEFHGLLPWHQDQLARNGIGEEQFEQLNQIAHGLVTAQGKYAFEHPDGTIQSPDEMKEEEVQTKIDQLVNSLEIRADSGDRAKVDEDVKKRLRELGYA